MFNIETGKTAKYHVQEISRARKTKRYWLEKDTTAKA